jgi:hypothetical protein
VSVCGANPDIVLGPRSPQKWWNRTAHKKARYIVILSKAKDLCTFFAASRLHRSFASPRKTAATEVSGPHSSREKARNQRVLSVCSEKVSPENEARTPEPRPYLRLRSADCANRFASTLNSRRTCEIENFNDRASFWQVQCRE